MEFWTPATFGLISGGATVVAIALTTMLLTVRQLRRRTNAIAVAGRLLQKPPCILGDEDCDGQGSAHTTLTAYSGPPITIKVGAPRQ